MAAFRKYLIVCKIIYKNSIFYSKNVGCSQYFSSFFFKLKVNNIFSLNIYFVLIK